MWPRKIAKFKRGSGGVSAPEPKVRPISNLSKIVEAQLKAQVEADERRLMWEAAVAILGVEGVAHSPESVAEYVKSLRDELRK